MKSPLTLSELDKLPLPEPFGPGSKLPWDDPDFSKRMLAEHLSQAHDMASRQESRIETQIDWLSAHALPAPPARVLDLGCGPGLYCERLTEIGHRCHGVDFSPASIAHAKESSQAKGLECEYTLTDLRTFEPSTKHDAALVLFGEFNTFAPNDAERLLGMVRRALKPEGVAIFEVSSSASVEQIGAAPATWWRDEGGLFGDDPHIVLKQARYDVDAQASVEIFDVIELGNGEATRYASSTQAYTDDQYRAMFTKAGFEVERHGSLDGDAEPDAMGLFVWVARPAQ